MDQATAQLLNGMTADFYRRHAASFSQTRQEAWPGWHRVLACADSWGVKWDGARVLDVACGNGRFERFLAERLPSARISCRAIDSCEALSRELPAGGGNLHVEWAGIDMIAALLEGRLSEALKGGPFDCAVCFGFFHHVPSDALRASLLEALVDAVRPGGIAAVSLWRFLENPEMARKAHALQEGALQVAHERYGLAPGALDGGDFLLGWQGGIEALRYCHSFSDSEVEALSGGVQGKVRATARFTADGRTGDLNSYLVFQR